MNRGQDLFRFPFAKKLHKCVSRLDALFEPEAAVGQVAAHLVEPGLKLTIQNRDDLLASVYVDELNDAAAAGPHCILETGFDYERGA